MTRSDAPDPWQPSDESEFVTQLRRLKAWSGLSYRQIEQRAGLSGDTLPKSTLVTALGRDVLPREEMVVAFVRACGCPPETVAQWAAARRHLAMAAVSPIAETGIGGDSAAAPNGADLAQAATPLPRRATPGRPLLRLVTVSGLLFLLVGGSINSTEGRDTSGRDAAPAVHRPQSSGRRSTSTMPASGRYRIRLVHSGLCLSEQPRDTSGRVHQASCEQAFPPMTLQTEAGGTYRIAPIHPENGPGCMGIRGATTAPGEFVYDDYCGERGANAGGERLHLESVTAPSPGFRIRLIHSGLCLGVRGGSTTELAVVSQLACDPAAAGQTFVFDPVS
jgi:Helix-turn-helix domain